MHNVLCWLAAVPQVTGNLTVLFTGERKWWVWWSGGAFGAK